jgi:hypothetical protein
MAITGVLLAAVCVGLGVVMAVAFFEDPGGGVAGAMIFTLTACFLLAGGTYVGYAFVRAAVRMKDSTEPNQRRTLTSSVVWLVSAVSFWLLPMPDFSLALRVFVCVCLVVVGFAGLAQDLEPPRRKRR